ISGRASHTYSTARFYRGIAASMLFFFSPILTMRTHAAIRISVTFISALSFELAVKKIEKRDEQRLTD
ncbi:hypothetical protein PENTCL1PPCAC_19745, partial [Pristionchus entomophagus]